MPLLSLMNMKSVQGTPVPDKVRSTRSTLTYSDYRDSRSNIEESTTSQSLEPCSQGELQVHDFLRLVGCMEADISPLKLFDERRDRLRHYREDRSLVAKEDWPYIYAMFLYRNPSEIPHRPVSIQHDRWKAERSIYYSGTEEKEHRNFRQPGAAAFNIRIRQEDLFGGWSWPTERKTSKAHVIELGPHDEISQQVVEAPQGCNWQQVAGAQDQAEPKKDWKEEPYSVFPTYNNPVSKVRQECLAIKEDLDSVKMAVNDYSFEWEWDANEIMFHNWPKAHAWLGLKQKQKQEEKPKPSSPVQTLSSCEQDVTTALDESEAGLASSDGPSV